MNLPKRKRNRLSDFDYTQNGAYFITICTKDKMPLLGFIESVGADAHIGPTVRLTVCGKVAEKYLCSIPGIEKYVIMPNHIHMLLTISQPSSAGTMWASSPTQSIPNLVRSFKTMTTKELGKSIFQRSYHDHVIRNDADYLRIWQYIDTNPAKWLEDKYYGEEAL